MFKKFAHIILLACIPFNVVSQLTVTNMVPSEAVAMLMGSDGNAANIQFTGDPIQLGWVYNAPGNFETQNGLILSTSHVQNFIPNSLLGEPISPVNSENDLLSIANSVPPLIGQNFTVEAVNDVAILEFDFVAPSEILIVNFTYGSDEYLAYVNSQYNDVFAFLFSGPGISGQYSAPAAFPDGSTNLAIVPSSNPPLPITISSINNQVNAQFYNDNQGNTNNPGLSLTGYTSQITTATQLIPGQTYHLKIAIADGSDNSLKSQVVLNLSFDESTLNAGCTLLNACNYNPTANFDDGSCTFPGCTDSSAFNFDAAAGCADGSCLYPGCTLYNACNFDTTANFNDGSCTFPGCTNNTACNFQPSAGCDNGTCQFTATPCNDGNPNTINDQLNSVCNCVGQLLGCTNSSACNYNPLAEVDNGSCVFTAAACDDNDAFTIFDHITVDCNCQGIPISYGDIGYSWDEVCPGAPAQAMTISAPLNLTSYSLQWYYRDGSNSCPTGNSTAGWTPIAGETSLTYTPSEFEGSRTFACFVTPSAIYGIPANWVSGCKTVSYYSFNAQAIIGNPNIAPFSAVTYAVNPISGNSFNWSITNGAITSGQGTNVITVLWGQNGPYQVSLTESNGLCSDVSTLLVVNSNCSGISVAAIAENGNSLCQGSSTTLQAITQATNVTYQWYYNGIAISGATSGELEISNGGNYQVLLTQTACSAISQTLFINTLTSPAMPPITVNTNTSVCAGGSATLIAEGNQFNSFLWSNGETTNSIEVFTSGDYSVEVTDNNGCAVTAGPISVNLSLQEPLPICIVTVDATTGNNTIVWEPIASETTAAFAIYKETNVANEYAIIGSVNYGEDGLFNDANSNAAVQASRYKLALIDTCGTESSLTSHHKTIHLTFNMGMNGTVNLIWSHYEGFYFGSYTIYRGDSPGNLSLLATIASNLNSYTDLNPPAGNFYYVIEVEGVSCDPTRDVIVSRSNVILVNPINVEEEHEPIVALYPNPTYSMLQLQLNTGTVGKDIVITSATGAIVAQQKITNDTMIISMDDCAAGFYILQVRDGNQILTSRQVIVR